MRNWNHRIDELLAKYNLPDIEVIERAVETGTPLEQLTPEQTVLREIADLTQGIFTTESAITGQNDRVKRIADRLPEALDRGRSLNELGEYQGASDRVDVLLAHLHGQHAALDRLARVYLALRRDSEKQQGREGMLTCGCWEHAVRANAHHDNCQFAGQTATAYPWIRARARYMNSTNQDWIEEQIAVARGVGAPLDTYSVDFETSKHALRVRGWKTADNASEEFRRFVREEYQQ